MQLACVHVARDGTAHVFAHVILFVCCLFLFCPFCLVFTFVVVSVFVFSCFCIITIHILACSAELTLCFDFIIYLAIMSLQYEWVNVLFFFVSLGCSGNVVLHCRQFVCVAI